MNNMSLEERINADIKKAMLAKDREKIRFTKSS